MAAHLTIQQRMAAYYRSTDRKGWAERQEAANAASQNRQPIATLKFVSTDTGMARKMEVQFFHNIDNALFARIYDLYDAGVVKRRLIATVSEEQIIHWGWIYDTAASKMDAAQKTALIANLGNMQIYKIKGDNIYIY